RDELLAFARRWEVRRLEQVATEQGVGDAEAGSTARRRPPERRGDPAEQPPAVADPPRREPAAATPSPLRIPPPASPLAATLAPAIQGELFATADAEAGLDPDTIAAQVHVVRARALHGLAVLPVTDGASPRHARVVGVAFAARNGDHCYVPLAHDSGPNVSPEQLRAWFGAILADPTVDKVAYDWKRALHELARGHLGV